MTISAYVETVSPRWGTVEGGTEVTFTGARLSTVPSDYSILIDGIPCAVSEAATDSVKCITGPRTGLYEEDPSLEIFIAGVGNVATQGLVYRYVSLWSSESTWGGLFAPVDGESVSVPKGLNLLVDIDFSPVLNLVIVDGGSIIFPPNSDPNHKRTFDAHYIFINNGYMEVGTEAEPYTSKITITMHGKKYDPYMPIYGNKCIGVRYSTLDIHGVPRSHTWTSLANPGKEGED